jgi:sugar phosphate isomerase/epimerase
MSRARTVSINGAPYDGHPVPHMLHSLASIGVTHVEPAFIVGYTEPFDESAFTPEHTVEYARWLADAGLSVRAMSSHIDLGRHDALEVFTGRMQFAARIGAKVINTNAAARTNEARFFRHIGPLARLAEARDLTIGLENPGDGSDNLLNTAADGPDLLARIGHPRVGLNYDAGNTISHRLAWPLRRMRWRRCRCACTPTSRMCNAAPKAISSRRWGRARSAASASCRPWPPCPCTCPSRSRCAYTGAPMPSPAAQTAP